MGNRRVHMMISLGADGGGGKICGEGIRTI